MPKSPRSLLGRITWRLLALKMAATILVVIFLAINFRSAAIIQRDRGLFDRAEAIADALSIGDDGTMSLDLPESEAGPYREGGESTFSVIDSELRVLHSSEPSGTLLHPFHPHPESAIEYFEHIVTDGSDTFYGVTAIFERGDRPIWVQVAQKVADSDVLLTRLTKGVLVTAIWVVVPFFLGLLVINIWTVRRALAPIRKASAQAAAIGPKTMDLRMPEEGMPSEIVPMVTAVNSALDRVQRGYELQRAFAADAAHELRTPLAVLRANVDTLADKREAAALREDVDAMAKIVTELLDLADLEQANLQEAGYVDLREVCAEVAATLTPLAIKRGRSIALSGAEGPVPVRGHRDALARAVRNLVDNALSHAPENTCIDIEIGDDAVVRVIDDGHGVPAGQRELIFQRSWRNDRRGGQGSGLGLYIAARTIELHEGSVEVDDVPGRGAVFTVRLTRVDTAA